MRIRFYQSARRWVGLLVALILVSKEAWGMFFYIEQGGEQCFGKDVPRDTVILGEYYLPGNPNPGHVSMRVVSEDNLRHLGSSRTPMFDKVLDGEDGHIVFTTETQGVHSICFAVPGLPASVDPGQKQKMYFRLRAGESAIDLNSLATSKHFSKAEAAIELMMGKVEEIYAEQRMITEREEDYRDASDAANSSVLWIGLLQAGILVLGVVVQVYYLRFFFKKQKLI